jgi:ring-1,2-phenylacetyl-CoA epoxidase subunit PaaC
VTRCTGTRRSTRSPTTFRTCDNPYDLLSAVHDDDRWAFGTGFSDPLSGVDMSIPAEVDAAELAALCLALGDDALIYSHRLQEWVTRMPELEEETAIANVALDLLGQARLLLSRAGSILGRTEDQLAFFRVEKEFRNVRLAEHADADFAELVGRLLIFSSWRLSLLSSLVSSPDPVLAAIAAKGVNELAYHRDYAAEWVVRLGDGTDVSHERMERALSVLWPLTGELSDADWRASVESVLSSAGLTRPHDPAATGRDGVHTEAMGYILAELQSVARTYPDATW